MASPDQRRSMGVDRRVSLRSPVTVAIPVSDDESSDDEYDLAAMGISDGFRPSNRPTESMPMAGMGHQRMASLRMSQHSQYDQTPVRRSTPPPRPSSTTKPRNLDNFALRHDGATDHSAPMGPAAMASASAAGLLTRTASSTSTDEPYMRTESPYQGPSVPSHPYDMYPQDARLARTASMATTSTYQPMADRRSVYNGPAGPTHPYGLYPQNTVEEPDEPTPVAPIIPVGFPGRVDRYQRRLGPEGEEAADLIGPDGHTEQLPPYTQYPESAMARKAAAMAGASVVGAGVLGVATAVPASASRDELSNPFESPISRTATLTSQSVAGPDRTSSTEAMTPENEKDEDKPWQKFMKRKAFGIVPMWVLFLAGSLIVLFAIVIGVAVAVVKGRFKGGPPPNSASPSPTSDHNQYATTVTTTYDATPLPTAPANLPALPTGSYWLNIQGAQTQSASCISNTALYGAWSCSIPLNMLRMNVASITSSTGSITNEVSISQASSSSSGASNQPPDYFYGSQPPTISGAQVMDLVSDANDKLYGPAWFFQIPYDKLVIVNENALAVPSSSAASKRSFTYKAYNNLRQGSSSYDSDPVRRGQSPGIGDKPWFCYWNHTLLETFIYPNASSSNTQSSSSSSSLGSATATSNPYAASSVSPGSAPSPSTYVLTQFAAPYPKIVRVKERRLPYDQKDPYCVQMQILNSGWAYPWKDANGNQATIQLNETEAQAVSTGTSKRDGMVYGLGTEMEKRDTDSDCNCVWLAS